MDAGPKWALCRGAGRSRRPGRAHRRAGCRRRSRGRCPRRRSRRPRSLPSATAARRGSRSSIASNSFFGSTHCQPCGIHFAARYVARRRHGEPGSAARLRAPPAHPCAPDRAAQLVDDHAVLDRLAAAAELQQPGTDRGVVHLRQVAGQHLVGDAHRRRHRPELHAQELGVARTDVGRLLNFTSSPGSRNCIVPGSSPASATPLASATPSPIRLSSGDSA